MCDNAVRDDSFSLQFVPDWFVTQQQIKIWHDEDDYCSDNETIKWYDGYQKRKSQKASIKDEFFFFFYFLFYVDIQSSSENLQ